MKKHKYRAYSDEFIHDAVELYKSNDKTMTQVAKSLGVPTTTLRQWIGPLKGVKRTNAKAFGPDRQKIMKLERELHDVKQQRDILKKALTIFTETQG